MNAVPEPTSPHPAPADNEQLIQAALADDLVAVERLLRKLLSTDRWTESAIDLALRNVTDQKLWSRLLEVLVLRTWNGQPVPVAPPAIAAGRSLDLKLRSLFLDDGSDGASARLAALLEGQTSEIAEVWQMAALLLGQRGDTRATESLLRALREGDSKTQSRVAAILCNLQDDRVVLPLIETLATGDDIIHWEAAKSLVAIGVRAVPELCETLQQTNDDHLRWHITRALGEIGDPKAIPVLIELLADENAGVRWRAAEALVAIGHDSLVPLLRKLTSEKLTPSLRNSALAILRGLVDRQNASLLQPLIEALRNREASVEAPIIAEQVLNQIEG